MYSTKEVHASGRELQQFSFLIAAKYNTRSKTVKTCISYLATHTCNRTYPFTQSINEGYPVTHHA